MDKQKSCYNCTHDVVCKHFGNWTKLYMIRDEGLREVLNTIARIFGKWCMSYVRLEEADDESTG